MSHKLGLKARRTQGIVDPRTAATRASDASTDVTINELRSYIERLHSQLRTASKVASEQGALAESHSWNVDRLSSQLTSATQRAVQSLYIGGASGLIVGCMFGLSLARVAM